MSDQDDVWRAISELRTELRSHAARVDGLATMNAERGTYVRNLERKISALESFSPELMAERIAKLEREQSTMDDAYYTRFGRLEKRVEEPHAHPDQARRIAALEAEVIELRARSDEGYPAAVAGDIERLHKRSIGHDGMLEALGRDTTGAMENIVTLTAQFQDHRSFSRNALDDHNKAIGDWIKTSRDALIRITKLEGEHANAPGMSERISNLEARADNTGRELTRIEHVIRDWVKTGDVLTAEMNALNKEVGSAVYSHAEIHALAANVGVAREQIINLAGAHAGLNTRLEALENAEPIARNAIDWNGFRRLVSRVDATAKQSDDLGGRLADLDETVKDLVAMSNPHGPVVATGKLDDDITITVHRVEVKDPDRWVAEMEKRLADAPLSTDRPKPSETMPLWQRRVMDEIDSPTSFRSEGPPPVMIGLDEFVPVSTTPNEQKLAVCAKEIQRLHGIRAQLKAANIQHKKDKETLKATCVDVNKHASELLAERENSRIVVRQLDEHIASLESKVTGLRRDLEAMTQRYRDEEVRRVNAENQCGEMRSTMALIDKDRADLSMDMEIEKLKAPLFDLARKYVTGMRSVKYAGPEAHPLFSTLCEMVEADDAYEKAMSSSADLADSDDPF